MFSRTNEIRTQFSQFLDALLLGLAFWCAHAVRYHGVVVWDDLWEIPDFQHFIWVLAVLMPFGPFMLEMQGFYNYPLEKDLWKSVRQIISAGMGLFILLALAVIFLQLPIPSRSMLMIYAVLAPAVLLLRERIMAWLYLRSISRGAVGERVILAGEKKAMRDLMLSFTPTQRMEIMISEAIDLQLRSINYLVNAIHRHSVGRVILAFSKVEMDKVQHAIEACETEGVEAWLNADFIHTSIARPTYESLARRPMLVFRTTPELTWALMIKNLIDRLGAFFGLLLLSPLFAVVSALIALTSPGPIFFRQKRSGLYGKPFFMWKFRSMVVDAEAKREEVAKANTMSGPVFKADHDPRITRIGKWIRKTSIDELPQLINVLRGEMSLVGPRPLPVYEVEKFEKTAHRRRLSMKPGLTCIWQVRGRNKVTDFHEWVKMDLEYIDNWSLLLDFYILLMTVPAVLLAKGAK